MTQSKCPSCGQTTGFDVIPTFPSGVSFKNEEIISDTFSLKVSCKNCNKTFDVVDFHTNRQLEGLWRQIELLKEQLNSVK